MEHLCRKNIWNLKFLNYEQKVIKVEAGKFHYSYHPGKKEFETVFGHLIKNDDYSKHQVLIKFDNSISNPVAGRTEYVPPSVLDPVSPEP